MFSLNKTKGKVITCPVCNGTKMRPMSKLKFWVNDEFFVTHENIGEDKTYCQECDEDGKVYFSKSTDVYRFYKGTKHYRILSNKEIRNYKGKYSEDTFSNEYIDIEVDCTSDFSLISLEFIKELTETFPEYKISIEEALTWDKIINFISKIPEKVQEELYNNLLEFGENIFANNMYDNNDYISEEENNHNDEMPFEE